MALNISGLNELRERLERLRAEEVMARALAEQAERVAARVRDGLSEPPGAAGHDEPWLQSGALRDSVGAQADGLQAAVGSSDPAAVPQEMGTAHMPPRLFLAPVAAGGGGGGRPGRGRGRSSRLEGRAGRRRRYPCRRVVKRPNPQRSVQSVRRFPARLARERGLDAQHDTAPPGTRPRFSFGAGGWGGQGQGRFAGRGSRSGQAGVQAQRCAPPETPSL